MNSQTKKIYSSAIIIIIALLSILFFATKYGRIITAIFLALAALAVCVLIRKRISLSINKREVLLLSVIIAALFVILILFSGAFFGFYKNPYFMKPSELLNVALPTAVIIIASEIIRYVFLSQKKGIVSVITFAICVVAEMLTASTIPEILTFNKFMDVVGLTLFPAIIANVYYHYSSKRYGMLPNIAFRLITALYVYFIPTNSGMSEVLLACLKIILPMIMLAFISAMFEKKKVKAVQKGKKLNTVIALCTALFIISVAMLVSCRFHYGAIVVATGSMTGEINKGDVIIYERYEGEQIREGQVIVFMQNDSKIIHRVVEIENIGGELRYYTKGDANDDRDQGYRTEEDIFGLTDFKVSYVGFPTLWLRDLMSKR